VSPQPAHPDEVVPYLIVTVYTAVRAAGTRSFGIDRYADIDSAASTGVYVLELAGQDDEFAAYEAEHAASDLSILGPGLATARGISDRFEGLAYTHRASELIGRAYPTVADACSLLDAASIERMGTVAVRAVDVRSTTGIDTQKAERELGNVLVRRGFEVDLDNPDHELRALFSGGENGACALGWLAAETVRSFGERKPTDRPFFQPGSMDPMLAHALANIAGARPGATVLDPMCGTGGILIEAGLAGSRVVGLDVQGKMVRGTRENLVAFLDRDWDVIRGEAGPYRLPIARSIRSSSTPRTAARRKSRANSTS